MGPWWIPPPPATGTFLAPGAAPRGDGKLRLLAGGTAGSPRITETELDGIGWNWMKSSGIG